MAIAWIDAGAGVAGDMLLGALLDAGASLDAVRDAVRAVVGDAVALGTETVQRAGLRAVRVRVELHDEPGVHRAWRDIDALLCSASLPARTRELSLATFQRLAAAEGRVHGIDPADVHFHEVGSLDAIADVVGVCAAADDLGLTVVTGSPVALGEGRIAAAHGSLPVPPPAVAELALGWPVTALPARSRGDLSAHAVPEHDHPHSHPHPHDHPHQQGGHDHGHEEAPAEPVSAAMVGELATPTGMALLRTLAGSAGPMPAMTVGAIGVGAGGRDLPGWANCVRVVIGDDAAAQQSAETVHELRANLDDLEPRLVPGVVDRLLAAGALDAWVVPVTMKKGRPGMVLHALATDAVRAALVELLLTHTTTLGVRWTPCERVVLQRGWCDVEVRGRVLPVKLGHRDAVIVRATPEFEPLAAASRDLGVPEATLLQEATAALVADGLVAGAPAPVLRPTQHDVDPVQPRGAAQ